MNAFGRFYNNGRCMRSASEARAVFERAQRAAHARRGGEIVEQDISATRPLIVNSAVVSVFRAGGLFAANNRSASA